MAISLDTVSWYSISHIANNYIRSEGLNNLLQGKYLKLKTLILGNDKIN